MSVTFSVETVPTGRYTIWASCSEDTHVDPFDGVVHDSYTDAYQALLAHRETCADCADYSQVTAQVDVTTTEVNLATDNAREILTRLGYNDPELVGGTNGPDFLARVVTALAFADDTAVATVDSTTDHGPRWVDVGRPAGYQTRTLTRLHTIAEEAIALNRDVTWA